MWDRKEVKATGKAAFKANYWKCILVALLLTILAGGTARTASSQAQSQINPDGSDPVVDALHHPGTHQNVFLSPRPVYPER